MTFAISARGSAVWCLAATITCTIAIIFTRRKRMKAETNGLQHERLMARLASPFSKRVVATGGITVAIFVTFALVRNSWIDQQYFQEDNYPHHLFWHNAYLGLSLNPQWLTKRPQYADVPVSGDEAAFRLFQHVMVERGLPYASAARPGFYLARAYESFIRDAYLKFLMNNPSYSAALFFYYKPLVLIRSIMELAGAVPLVNWLITAGSLTLLCLAFGTSETKFEELLICVAILWLWSLAPVIWTYPIQHVDSDPFWTTAYLFLTMFGFLIRLPSNLVVRVLDTSSAEASSTPVGGVVRS
jgi:hypothetical protein